MKAHKNILLLAPIQENFWKFTCFLFEWAQNRRAAKHFPSLSKSFDSKVKQLASKCSKVNEFERVIRSSKAYKLGSRPAALPVAKHAMRHHLLWFIRARRLMYAWYKRDVGTDAQCTHQDTSLLAHIVICVVFQSFWLRYYNACMNKG